MKANLGLVLIVAVASSLVTAGVLELVRVRPHVAPVEARVPNPEPAPDPAEPVPARVPEELQPPDLGQASRLAEIERRLAAIERALTSSRAPVGADGAALDEREALRTQVLDWVAADRERRIQEAERDEEEAIRKEREFDVRVEVRRLAQEHGLSTWQEERLVAVWLEVEDKRRELEESVDPLTAVPEEVEQQFAGFEAWVRQRIEEELGSELATEIFGEEEG